MQDRYKTLTKNVGLFALSGFVPKALSFFLVPLYTNILTTGEYGVSDLITTTVSLLVPIFTVDIQDAAMRYALDEEADSRQVFTFGARTVFLGTVLVSLGAFVASSLGIPGPEPMYCLFTALMFFVTAGTNVLSLFCRGIDEVKSVAVSSICNSAITLVCNIVFLVVFGWGLTGYLVANTVGSAIAMVIMFIMARLWRYLGGQVDRALAKEMLSYSFPLVFSVVAWWVNSASDRYLLTWICGVGVSGVYAVAYKIPSILSMFGNVFSQAWSISAIKEFDPEDSEGFFGGTFTLMNFAMVLMCSLVMIVNIPIASFIYAKDFFEAWRYVPPLLLSVVFDIMCQFVGGVFTATKETRSLSYTTIAGAAVNIIICLALIPFFGAMGAAIATAFGYAGVLVARLVALRKKIRMKVSYGRLAVTYAILLAQLLISEFGIGSIPVQFVIFVVLVASHRGEAAKVLGLLKNAVASRLP